jgi:hypothetical protein
MTTLGDNARDVLERYRAGIAPTAAQREAVVRGTLQRLDAGPPSGGGGSGAPASHGGTGLWVVLVAAAVAVGGLMLWPRLDVGAPAVTAMAAPTPVPADPALDPAPEDPPPIERVAAPRTDPPVAAITATPTEAVERPRRPRGRKGRAMATPSAEPQPGAAVGAVGAASPSSIDLDLDPEPEAEPQPQPEPASETPRAPTSEPTVTQSAGPPLVDEEVRLLRAANAALRAGGDAQARERFDEHARRFPKGALVELRELGRAILRCRSGHSEEVVRAFERRFGDTPHLARLRRACTRSATR